MELRTGIIDGRWTPCAAQQAIWMVAQLPPLAVERGFDLLGRMTPSRATLDRLPKQVSEGWEQDRENLEVALRAQEPVPAEAKSVSISLDGAMAPMRGLRVVAENGEVQQPTVYHEVGVGTVSLIDPDGNVLEARRFARMPESKKATLKAMLTAELAAIVAQRPDLIVHRQADGAHDNWTFLDQLAANKDFEGPRNIDFWHAAEHLKDALDAAYGKGDDSGLAQYEKLRHVLRHEPLGAESVIRALRYLRDKFPRRSVIQRELSYFRRNKKKMRYATIAALGLPIGTGLTEAACKTLTGRLKLSGMRWDEDGGQAILTFRGFIQSSRFDRAWRLIVARHRREVFVPDNVVPLPTRAQRSSISA
jgi:hypothetical protein